MDWHNRGGIIRIHFTRFTPLDWSAFLLLFEVAKSTTRASSQGSVPTWLSARGAPPSERDEGSLFGMTFRPEARVTLTFAGLVVPNPSLTTKVDATKD